VLYEILKSEKLITMEEKSKKTFELTAYSKVFG